MPRILCWFALTLLLACRPGDAQDAVAAPEPAGAAAVNASEPAAGARRALIVAGLPGDDQHRRQFRELVAHWLRWLTADLQFQRKHVVVLSGTRDADPGADRPATREALRQAVQQIQREAQPEDACWVFVLGHGDYDDERAHLHLPGPDVNDKAFAEMFAGLPCREQVFWLTHSCSGWFLKPLSRKGRIVITASLADLEDNETEFPYALAEASELAWSELDANGDDRVSVAELFRRTATGVTARFAADQRAPTEHALLDDNGDGRGTEAEELSAALKEASKEAGPSTEAGALEEPGALGKAGVLEKAGPQAGAEPPVAVAGVKAADGELAGATFLPRKPAPPRTPTEPDPSAEAREP